MEKKYNIAINYIEMLNKLDFLEMQKILSKTVVTQLIDGHNTTEETSITKQDFISSLKNWMPNLDSYEMSILEWYEILDKKDYYIVSFAYKSHYDLSGRNLLLEGVNHLVVDIKSNKITKILNIIKSRKGDSNIIQDSYY